MVDDDGATTVKFDAAQVKRFVEQVEAAEANKPAVDAVILAPWAIAGRTAVVGAAPVWCA